MLYQLIISALVFLPSIVATIMGKRKAGFWLLLFAAFVIRLMMIGLDPFLHDWDERFHAVVAKNMMSYPFKPMMRLEALLPFKVEDWCCNYIWVHKQPLFLWQMALSMKIFGVNTIALRLPNALMGTFVVFCTYRIAEIWTRNNMSAYIAALLVALSYYSLELCSGRMSLDHNDVMMGGYVTASIWTFCEYTNNKHWKWAQLTGVFAGCAILVKWLTGLLIFGGWAVYLISDNILRTELRAYKQFAGALATCVAIFLPWQIYISMAFPAESAAAYAYNYKHIIEDLDHPGDHLTHINFMTTAYSGGLMLAFLVLGLLLSFRSTINQKISIAMVAMFAVVYAFFSLIVATKMPGLTYPVAVIGFIWMGIGIQFLAGVGKNLNSRTAPFIATAVPVLLLFLLGLYTYQPHKMARARKTDDVERNKKIHNTTIYRHLNEQVTPDEIILNCKSFEDTEVRFWQPNNAYHWYPPEQDINDLLNRGYKLAAFKSHNDQGLPEYIYKNPRIKIIDLQLE